MSQKIICWACAQGQANQLAHIGGCIPIDYDLLTSDEDDSSVSDVVYITQDDVNKIMYEVDKKYHHDMSNNKRDEIKNFVTQYETTNKAVDSEMRQHLLDRIYAHLDFGHDLTSDEK